MKRIGMYRNARMLGAVLSIIAATPAFGQNLSGEQVLAKCREAYDSLKTYKGTSRVTVKSNASGKPTTMNTLAKIQFVRPNKIRVEGETMFGSRFGYLSDGKRSYQTVPSGGWRAVEKIEAAVAGATGISLSAGTTIPATLLKIRWGNPFSPGYQLEAKVAQENVNGRPAYRLNMHTPVGKTTLWVDKQTFLIVKLYETRDLGKIFLGQSRNTPKPQGRMEYTHLFTDVKPNATIPTSAFAKPATK